MNYREISRILGNYLLYFALILCVPLGVAIYFQFVLDDQANPKPDSTIEFLATLGICLLIAYIFKFFGKKSEGNVHKRESIILVVLIWFITSFIGALPFYLTGTLNNPVDAYFETISGFTTTGASMMTAKKYDADGKEVLQTIENPNVPRKTYSYYGTIEPIRDKSGKILFEGVEAVGYAVLFWRNFIQWLGGMGIVVLFLTVLPALGVGGKFLFQMESTGPIKEAISPRIKETASLLWKLYLGLTLMQVVLLLWTNVNMDLFDSVAVSLSTISTGGYSIKNLSIGAYANANTEWIVILFMILGSINFSLYFHILRAKFYKIYVPDFFLFIGSVLFFSGTITYIIYGKPLALFYQSQDTFITTLRTGLFQSISAQTSTGYTTANYDVWPFSAQMFMLIIMFLGGMSGATCGGIKTPRFYILFKILVYQVQAMFRPEAVKKLKIENAHIDMKTALTVLSFFAIVAFITSLGTVLYILDGIDPETSFGLTGCMLNNIGIAFRAAGPLDTFVFLSPISKILSTLWMLLGRLEFYSVLILFLPSFWQTK